MESLNYYLRNKFPWCRFSDPRRRRTEIKGRPRTSPVYKPPEPGQRVTGFAPDVYRTFGGVTALQTLLRANGHPYSIVSLYRWNMPYPQGSAGAVPRRAWLAVMDVSAKTEIPLTAVRLVVAPSKAKHRTRLDRADKWLKNPGKRGPKPGFKRKRRTMGVLK